ncbi:IS1595 family transposase [Parvicella tangerina]|uniref:IS1595 family transposase ISLesa1 n=1 Tax=Parvicella tangerina TaxID=2829795 RepID=A0A916JIB7_9FLAO|nr:IS1595 family transposase [Parvicella tangerina]CAG5076251.1 IS1595 family transposase ISLesa1 [Parvicella tangerina]
MESFKDIEYFVNALSGERLTYLKSYIKSLVPNLLEVREEQVENLCCPDCGSDKLKKNGNYGDKQKFVCKACNRGFGILSGTCVHGLHKRELWTRFIEFTLESMSIRKICEELNISRQTCLDWRHKLLTSINEVFTKEFHGIVEMDDMLMRLNQKGRREDFIEESRRTKTITNRYGNRVSMRLKGNRKRGISRDQVSVLLTVDRYGTVGTGMLKRGKMDSNSLNRVFGNGLLSRLNSDNTIVTDEAKAYVSVLNACGFDHEHINAGNKQWTKGIYHLNTLNNADGRFKKWIKYHFSSVSTKYLHNYLGYFKMLFFVLKSGEKMEEFLRFSLIDITSNFRFRNIENQYQTFLKY